MAARSFWRGNAGPTPVLPRGGETEDATPVRHGLLLRLYENPFRADYESDSTVAPNVMTTSVPTPETLTRAY